MKLTLAILTIDVVPFCDILPLFNGHISEDQITCFSLLENMTHKAVTAEYGASPGEQPLLVTLSDQNQVQVGRHKVTVALQSLIEQLDNQQYEVILLMSSTPVHGLSTRRAILLQPDRIIPPLVASMIDGHQPGVILPVADLISFQAKKWQILRNAPLYEIANLLGGTEQGLLDAGQKLVNDGADVLLLDCPQFHQKHQDFLQKKLNVPVLLPNMLLTRLASELLAG